ncbi:uncharacterized protein K460DRAFT_361157 [Cucurbitaria berberidis CBS 394.84]|uniref:Uncharacterized protein n=1 Tax=Cucurbitaria berberidis CBS 394.84 TaxID=1168544 RepID=A0A9P4GRZ1_9PLEO|nr:uncharacterized protein K460DRAFT_361157 [Cucurbitaria berberidis CBS 394.84]KAF1850351.1 hypothetical protein K460DRAFT_361157 [Cucurbitaria berberidis CBS 394.84]
MSTMDDKYPEDKERGENTTTSQQHALDRSNTSNPPTHSARQTAFLLTLLWTCWLVACTSDTFLSIERAMATYTRMTPLQYWIYRKRWDVWVYRTSPWPILPGPALTKICIASLTLCTLLFLTLTNTRHASKDDVSLAVTNLSMSVCIVVGTWVGAAPREVALIAMPIGWLVAATGFLVCSRATGNRDFGAALHVSEKVGSWVNSASLAVFFALNVWVFGFENEFVILYCAWRAVGVVYRWLG